MRPPVGRGGPGSLPDRRTQSGQRAGCRKDYRALSGGRARLQSVHLFSPLAALPANPTERLPENNDTVLSLVARETGHRWGASVRFRDASGRLRRDLQGREGSHWSFFLDSGASALEGNRWEHIGRYHWSLTPTDGYSPLDQYLMGLRPPEEVPPARLLRGARVCQLDRIRGCWEAYFFRATEGRAR